jgi:hypothetical protein
MKHLTLCSLLLSSAIPMLPTYASKFSESFSPGSVTPGWELTYQVPGQSSLVWPATGGKPGLKFESEGVAKLERKIDVPAGPFEFSADVEIDRGLAENWQQSGIAIALTTDPVEQMGTYDAPRWGVLFQAIQEGVVANVPVQNCQWGSDVRFRGGEIAERYTMTMAGANGSSYSILWPDRNLAGTRLRFHAWRDAANQMRLSVYNSEAPNGPWWEASAPLPEKYLDLPLKYLTVFIAQRYDAFGVPEAKPVPMVASAGGDTGKGKLAGRITAIHIATVDSDKPKWNTPLPAVADTTKAQPRPKGTVSALLPREGGLKALREKFNDPAFANYRAVLMRNTSTSGLAWLYLLTGERAYFDKAMAAIDAECGFSMDIPGMMHEKPGHIRQNINITGYNFARLALLAEAYDLLYDEIEPTRRDAMRRILLRTLNLYIDNLKSGAWFEANNPSNTIGVSNGANGIIALALRPEYPELANAALDMGVEKIKTVYKAVAADGGCREGNMYWNYGYSYPMYLAYALRNATGDDRGLQSSDQFRNVYRYIETNLGGDGKLMSFCDTQPWLIGWPIISASSSLRDQPLLRWMADHMAEEFAGRPSVGEQDADHLGEMAFLFRDRKAAPKDFPGVPTLSMLESINQGVMRSDRAFFPGMVVGIKGNGDLNTHHAQEDQGSFVLQARGEAFLLDPGYFQSVATDHSLPLIGDVLQSNAVASFTAGGTAIVSTTPGATFNPDALAPVFDAWEKGPLRSMTVDSTLVYKGNADGTPKAALVQRVFVLAGDKGAVVLDNVQPTKPGSQITSFYQAGFPATALPEDKGFRIEGKKSDLIGLIDGPKGPLSITPMKFNTKWLFDAQGVKWHRLEAPYTYDANTPRVTVLMPVDKGAAVPAAAVKRDGNKITVTIPGAPVVEFASENGKWKSVMPAGK